MKTIIDTLKQLCVDYQKHLGKSIQYEIKKDKNRISDKNPFDLEEFIEDAFMTEGEIETIYKPIGSEFNSLNSAISKLLIVHLMLKYLNNEDNVSNCKKVLSHLIARNKETLTPHRAHHPLTFFMKSKGARFVSKLTDQLDKIKEIQHPTPMQELGSQH